MQRFYCKYRELGCKHIGFTKATGKCKETHEKEVCEFRPEANKIPPRIHGNAKKKDVSSVSRKPKVIEMTTPRTPPPRSPPASFKKISEDLFDDLDGSLPTSVGSNTPVRVRTSNLPQLTPSPVSEKRPAFEDLHDNFLFLFHTNLQTLKAKSLKQRKHDQWSVTECLRQANVLLELNK